MKVDSSLMVKILNAYYWNRWVICTLSNLHPVPPTLILLERWSDFGHQFPTPQFLLLLAKDLILYQTLYWKSRLFQLRWVSHVEALLKRENCKFPTAGRGRCRAKYLIVTWVLHNLIWLLVLVLVALILNWNHKILTDQSENINPVLCPWHSPVTTSQRGDP